MVRPRARTQKADWQAVTGQKAFSPDREYVWQYPDLDGWREDASCARVDPELWFPQAGGNANVAKRICAACPVKQECLAFALDTDERFGVWGGLHERARRPLHQAVNRGADATDVAITALYGQEALRTWTA